MVSFKDYVKSRSTIDYWKSPDHLASLVAPSLYKQFNRTERPGWVRGGDAQSSLDTINDLSQRIRKLEDENNRLRGTVSTRAPELLVTMSCSETLMQAEDEVNSCSNSEEQGKKYEVDEENKFITLYMKRIPQEGYLGNTEKLDMEDVPEHLKSYVTEDDINEYNCNIPNKSEIDEYNKRYYYCRIIKENGMILRVSVDNIGNAKATDVNITFDFPEEIVTIEKDDAIGLEYPKTPKMPKNPIYGAEMKYKKNEMGVLSGNPLEIYVSSLGDIMPKMSFANDSLLDSARLL